jgi:hypothetical protein
MKEANIGLYVIQTAGFNYFTSTRRERFDLAFRTLC